MTAFDKFKYKNKENTMKKIEESVENDDEIGYT